MYNYFDEVCNDCLDLTTLESDPAGNIINFLKLPGQLFFSTGNVNKRERERGIRRFTGVYAEMVIHGIRPDQKNPGIMDPHAEIEYKPNAKGNRLETVLSIYQMIKTKGLWIVDRGSRPDSSDLLPPTEYVEMVTIQSFEPEPSFDD